MGYNPYDYQELFPLGMFGYPNQPLENWGQSHRLFALNQKPSDFTSLSLANGLTLKTGHIKQGLGFSNYLIVEIDTRLRTLDLFFVKDRMLYPVDLFKKLPEVWFLTNMGYFYLTDDEKADPAAPPKIRTGNMVIQNGMVLNLPILDRSSFIIYQNGSIDLLFLKPQGWLSINGRSYPWKGSKADEIKQGEIVVYNSSNIEIDIKNDPVMGPSRQVKRVYLTPSKGRKFLVCERLGGTFRVIQISKQATFLNDKDMLLEVDDKVTVKTGNLVKMQTVDEVKVQEVKSAISIGPMLFKDRQKTLRQIKLEKFGCDMATPNNPHEETKKLSRGCLLKISNTKLVSILVDGIPQAGDIYPGVTLSELLDFVKSQYPHFERAVCTDPSSTMKAVYRTKTGVKVFGNTHYLAHKRNKDGTLSFWPNGLRGRKIASAMVIY